MFIVGAKIEKRILIPKIEKAKVFTIYEVRFLSRK